MSWRSADPLPTRRVTLDRFAAVNRCVHAPAAPAPARSSLGIAMGVAGTDAALETADVALMGDDLSRLPWLIRHSRRTLRIIRQNVAASLLVLLNALRLLNAGRANRT